MPRTLFILLTLLFAAARSPGEKTVDIAPDSDPGINMSLELEPVFREELPEAAVKESVAQHIHAIKARLTNNGLRPVKLIWGDFLVRINHGKWVGSWWKPDKSDPENLRAAFQLDEGLHTPQLAPGQTAEYVLTDPWISAEDNMEYKLVCLFSDESGYIMSSESPPVQAVTIEVDKSGLLRAMAGITSALQGLFPSTPQAKTSAPGEFGVSIEHKPVGPVEATKNQALIEEIQSWQKSESSAGHTPADQVYVYQSEIANNTNAPLRLTQLEVSTRHMENWISGALVQGLRGEDTIKRTGSLQDIGPDGSPKLVKLSNSWIPPGGRAIFPMHWHPKWEQEDKTPARWRAVLVTIHGDPVFAEGITDPDAPTLLLKSNPAP